MGKEQFNLIDDLMCNYNQKLIESEKEFFETFDRVMGILLQSDTEKLAFELENRLYKHFEVVKQEYFKVGQLVEIR